MQNPFRRILLVALLPLLLIGCSSGGEKTGESANGASSESAAAAKSSDDVVQSINQLIKKDQYEQALSELGQADGITDSTRTRLKEKIHLNYGLYLEYRGGDRSMRERMTNALRQYIEVLRINRQNQKAISEIKQIMGIYQTMPEKSPPAEIKKELNALGVRY